MKHEADHGQGDHRLGDLRQAFIVLEQAASSAEPAAAPQSDLMRDNLQLVIDTNRRIAALSVRIADEAAGAIQAQGDNNADRVRHAA